jgi:hypothetical protein
MASASVHGDWVFTLTRKVAGSGTNLAHGGHASGVLAVGDLLVGWG